MDSMTSYINWYIGETRALKRREARMVTSATKSPLYALQENGAQHEGHRFYLNLSTLQGSRGNYLGKISLWSSCFIPVKLILLSLAYHDKATKMWLQLRAPASSILKYKTERESSLVITRRKGLGLYKCVYDKKAALYLIFEL